MKRYIIAIILIISTVFAFGQKERKFIRQGNKLYNKAVENSDSTHIDSISFANAEVKYRKALEKKPTDLKAESNIGNALFKQQKMAEASSQFEEALNMAKTKVDKAKIYFNYGDAMLGQKKFDESIEAYKNALRNDPKDLQAKYNLEFARRMKQQQQQQQKQQKQQNKNQNKDQNKDKNKNKNQNKNQQNKNDQNKNKQNKNQQNQNKDQNQQNKNQNKQQQKQPKISKQNAEQLLKALQNDEQKTQEKVKKAQAAKAKETKPDKDW